MMSRCAVAHRAFGLHGPPAATAQLFAVLPLASAARHYKRVKGKGAVNREGGTRVPAEQQQYRQRVEKLGERDGVLMAVISSATGRSSFEVTYKSPSTKKMITCAALPAGKLKFFGTRFNLGDEVRLQFSLDVEESNQTPRIIAKTRW